MTEDLLMDIMKHDKLVTEMKKSVLNHIAREKERERLQAERIKLRERRDNYDRKMRSAISKINNDIEKLDREENNLTRFVDEYDDDVEGIPRFSHEFVTLFQEFIETHIEKEEK